MSTDDGESIFDSPYSKPQKPGSVASDIITYHPTFHVDRTLEGISLRSGHINNPSDTATHLFRGNLN